MKGLIFAYHVLLVPTRLSELESTAYSARRDTKRLCMDPFTAAHVSLSIMPATLDLPHAQHVQWVQRLLLWALHFASSASLVPTATIALQDPLAVFHVQGTHTLIHLVHLSARHAHRAQFHP